MAKNSTDKLIDFLDMAGPRIDRVMRTYDKAEFNSLMDGLMEDFLKLDLSDKPRTRTVKSKPKVRRGIGSY